MLANSELSLVITLLEDLLHPESKSLSLGPLPVHHALISFSLYRHFFINCIQVTTALQTYVVCGGDVTPTLRLVS